MKIFCSGIGGIGVSAYAGSMQARGHTIVGTDRAPSALTESLIASGMSVTYVQDGSAIPDDCDLFVYSEAIPVTAPERKEAKKRGIRQLSYFAALGEMTKGQNVICVCGTHGKSSTSAMLAHILIDTGKDPNVIVGTKVPKLDGKNWRKGNSTLWVVEACEYRRSFLSLFPTMILLTNADGDHFDAFTSIGDYEKAFVEFIRLLPDGGAIIHHGADAPTNRILKASKRKGIDADNVVVPKLLVPGLHMRQNAQLALKACELLGIPEEEAKKSLQKFAGTWRRLETKRTTSAGITIVDDYAHHPKEILASLAALKEQYGDRRIVCVFQPHTHDRTLKLWHNFAQAFGDANVLVLTEVYDARSEEGAEKVDLEKFAENIRTTSGCELHIAKTLPEAKSVVENDVLKPGDVLVTMGAGDITKLSDSVLVE